MNKTALTAAALCVAALGLTSEAAAFDCAKAATRAEKAICADPAIKAADDAMAAAYTAMMKSLTGEQAKTAKDNQRAWLKRRDENCGYLEDAAEFGKCLLDDTVSRTAFLTGAAESGPGLGYALTPYFVARAASKKDCAAEVAVYKFGGAGGAGGKAYDAWVSGLVTGFAKDFGARDPEMGSDFSCEYAAGATISYAAPDLISSTIGYYVYGGGAHGNSDSASITIDLKAGKALAFQDVFPASAKAALVEACTAAIRAEKLVRIPDLADGLDEEMKGYAETIAEGVGNFERWAVYADRAEVTFAPYAVGSYAEGSYECALPNALLQSAAGSKGWIVK